MTTYTGIPNGDIDPESPVTTSLITLLRDNPLAIQEGDVSAPDIAMAALASYPFVQADIESAAVGRDELKTGTDVSNAGNIIQATAVQITLDAYCYFPMIHAENNDIHISGHTTDGASVDAPRLALVNTNGSNDYTYDLDYRYVNT